MPARSRAPEAATALAFAHTAEVARRPGNVEPLAEAGRLFGRLAHVLDAVEDLAADHAAGRWNPILAFGLTREEVRRTCDDAVLGVRLALQDASFVDGRLVHALLVHELPAAVDRTFASAPAPPPLTPPLTPEPTSRGPLLGCLGWLVACGTCEACYAEEYTDPCTGRRRKGACRNVADCECDCCCPDCSGCDCCCDCDCGC